MEMTPRISAVILAAGMSRRMGRPKPLLNFGGKSLIARIIESLHDSPRIDQIVVVTGHEREAIRAAVNALSQSTGRESRKLTFVDNTIYETGGMISSVQAGVRAIAGSCDAFFIVLADHSPPRASTLGAMIDAWGISKSAVVLPKHEGRHGHPILLSCALAPEILGLAFDQTLADTVTSHVSDSQEIIVDDPAILEDIDTPEDYSRALARWKRENAM